MTKKSAQILIIDDNETDSMIMKEALGKVIMGNTITILDNATDAIDLLNLKGDFKQSKRPDLMLLDLGMPDFDGFEFLRVIKKDPRFIHIPVIILSASKDPKEIFKSYKLGANCFIHKPNNITKFKQIVAIINEFWLGIAHLPQKD